MTYILKGLTSSPGLRFLHDISVCRLIPVGLLWMLIGKMLSYITYDLTDMNQIIPLEHSVCNQLYFMLLFALCDYIHPYNICIYYIITVTINSNCIFLILNIFHHFSIKQSFVKPMSVYWALFMERCGHLIFFCL